jgi:hypothetical protein
MKLLKKERSSKRTIKTTMERRKGEKFRATAIMKKERGTS